MVKKIAMVFEEVTFKFYSKVEHLFEQYRYSDIIHKLQFYYLVHNP